MIPQATPATCAHNDPAPISAAVRGVASAFAMHHARFLIVGSYAAAAHGLLRPAEAVEVWVEPSADNALRMVRVLAAFGIPLAGVPVKALQFPGFAMVFGCPPHRVEMTTTMPGLDFADAHAERLVAVLDGIEIPCLGLATLVHHLHYLGDSKSLADAEVLAEAVGLKAAMPSEASIRSKLETHPSEPSSS